MSQSLIIISYLTNKTYEILTDYLLDVCYSILFPNHFLISQSLKLEIKYNDVPICYVLYIVLYDLPSDSDDFPNHWHGFSADPRKLSTPPCATPWAATPASPSAPCVN